MKANLLKLSVLALALTTAACGRQNESVDSTTNNIADTIESAINSTSGATDDVSGESFVASRTEVKKSVWDLVIPTAHAASCTRTFAGNTAGTSCSRSIDCEVGVYSFVGSVAITKPAGLSCGSLLSLADGQSINRQANFTRAGRRGSIETKSSAHDNYLGESISGGSTLTRISSSQLSLAVNGVSKIVRNNAGSALVDISIKTSSPLVMNQIQRAGRVVESGTVEVHHNRAQFTASHQYDNVSWQSSCCYPVSGKIVSTFSGSVSGSATTTFNGCGSATIERDGSSKDIALENCE